MSPLSKVTEIDPSLQDVQEMNPENEQLDLFIKIEVDQSNGIGDQELDESWTKENEVRVKQWPLETQLIVNKLLPSERLLQTRHQSRGIRC